MLDFLWNMAKAAVPVLAVVEKGIQAVGSLFNGGTPTASAATAQAASETKTTSIANLPDSIAKVVGKTFQALANAQPSPAATTSNPSTPPATKPTAATESPAQAGAGSDTNTASANTAGAAAIQASFANPTNARTSMQGDQAVFENDNYIITAGKDNNTVDIYNKKTKEVYAAVGGPGMKIDGQQGFNFLGTTSLMLNDGTKVTLGKADDGKGGSLASKLTITNGAYGAQIIGIDSNKTGDLAVKEFQGQGQELDQAVDDGVLMEENQDININNGRGFAVSDMNGMKNGVTQGYLDTVYKTKPKTETAESLGQFAGGGAQPGGATQQPAAEIPATQPTNGTPSTNSAQPQPTQSPTPPSAKPAPKQVPKQREPQVDNKDPVKEPARRYSRPTRSNRPIPEDTSGPAKGNRRVCNGAPSWAKPCPKFDRRGNFEKPPSRRAAPAAPKSPPSRPVETTPSDNQGVYGKPGSDIAMARVQETTGRILRDRSVAIKIYA